MYGQASSYQHLSGTALFLLVIVFLITYLILTFYNPEWVQRSVNGHRTGQNDQGITMLWALGITIVVLFVLALMYYAFTCNWGQ